MVLCVIATVAVKTGRVCLRTMVGGGEVVVGYGGKVGRLDQSDWSQRP